MKLSEPIKDVIKNSDKKFKYQLLSRLKFDCDYYLSYGNANANCLWSGNEEQQIFDMLAIYKSFNDIDKPEWITFNDIMEYKMNMTHELSIFEAKNLIYLVDDKYLDRYIKYQDKDISRGWDVTTLKNFFKQLGVTVY